MEHHEETSTESKNPVVKAMKNTGVYAVLKNPSTGDVQTIAATTRTELGKLLSTEFEGFTIVQVFKGKILNISEKKSYSFN